jgi:hypothetical protein
LKLKIERDEGFCKKKFTPLCKELGTKFAERFEEIKNQMVA